MGTVALLVIIPYSIVAAYVGYCIGKGRGRKEMFKEIENAKKLHTHNS